MQTQNHLSGADKKRQEQVIGGAVLVIIGVLLLLGQLVPSAPFAGFFMLAIGALMLSAGIVTRMNGWLIPGGILSGIGLGVALMESVYAGAPSDFKGGIFLLAFAFGWALITILSALVTRRTIYWSLVVGAILATIGGALVIGGAALDALNALEKVWPLFLIAAGAWVIWKRGK
ncbi:MAG: hypothetical protein HY327_08725 [Chloroflexi bacterium]|nr:hypothetical protein [Chloroflexota bacterium]